jgi:hypothetical protein
MRQITPKSGLTFNGLHGVISHKIELFIASCENLKSYQDSSSLHPYALFHKNTFQYYVPIYASIFFKENFICICHLSCVCYISCLSHIFLFIYGRSNRVFGIIKFPVKQYSTVSIYFRSLRISYSSEDSVP